jgi:ribosomal protein L20
MKCSKLEKEEGRILRALLMAKLAIEFVTKSNAHANLDERHKQLYKKRLWIHRLTTLVLAVRLQWPTKLSALKNCHGVFHR